MHIGSRKNAFGWSNVETTVALWLVVFIVLAHLHIEIE